MEPRHRLSPARPEGCEATQLANRPQVLSHRLGDIICAVKQLLLRVPDELHRRLAARAARDGRSVNAVATEILDAAVDAEEGDRRARLRARAAGLGVLRVLPAAPVSEARRRRILASTKGLGPITDQFIADERNRM